MNLVQPESYPLCRVRCWRCAAWKSITDVLADIDAPFGTYYCGHCAAIVESQFAGEFPIGPMRPRALPESLAYHSPHISD